MLTSNITTPSLRGVKYENAETQNKKIYKENRGKIGVYRWTNIQSGNIYLGSSTNLSKRFSFYYSLTYLNKKANNSIICRALLKYGHSRFSLDILEYCESKFVIQREQYYIDNLKPEDKILQIAGSSLGYKHTEETLAKFRNKFFSHETLEKMRNVKLGLNHTEEDKKNISIAVKAAVTEFYITTKGIKIIVFNIENNTYEDYVSIRALAKALNAHMETIPRCLKNNKPYLDKYLISIKEKI